MVSSSSSSSSGGIGFLGLLAILFIGLKLTNFISWSWWWVLSPLWSPLVVFVTVFLVSLIFNILLAIARK